RMAPPRLLEAADQHLVVAIEKNQSRLRFHAGLGGARQLQQRIGGKAARAAIDAERHRPAGIDAPRQHAEHRERQVVDRLIAEILEKFQRDGAAGARHAGDQHHGFARRRLGRGALALALARASVRGGGGRRVIRQGQYLGTGAFFPIGIGAGAHEGSILWLATRRTASRTLAAAEAVKGSIMTSGKRMPSRVVPVSSGRRSISRLGLRSTTRRSHTPSSVSIGTGPMPRTSMKPAMVGGAEAMMRSATRSMRVWSSETSRAPPSISRTARSDLPLPEGPRSSTPVSPIITQVPCTSWLSLIA